MKVNLSKAQLAAALEAAATKDVRYYLNGVCLDFVNPHHLVYAGTDGHILYAGFTYASWVDGAPSESFQMIIPRDTVAQALKAAPKGAELIELESLEDGRYRLGALLFEAIDGRFPDYERVIPKTCTGEAGDYNPELLLRAFKAIAHAEGTSKAKTGVSAKLTQNGPTSSGIVQGECKGNICVVMPFRQPLDSYTGWMTLDRAQAKAA